MMVRRHFIKPSPGALRIDRNIFEYRHTIRSAGEDLLNKARLEVSLVTRSLVWIIPCQQKSAALGPEMETVRHIDDHGRGVRKLVKRLCRNQHTAQRLDKKVDAYHLCDRSRPRPSTVDDGAS